MLKKSSSLLLAALLTLAVGCSKDNGTLPTPTAAARTGNSIAPVDPDYPGGGGSDPSCTPTEASEEVKSSIKAYTIRQCRLNGWTIVTTITPPDGITYGLGCPGGSYPFSVDIIINSSGRRTYASGSYNSGTGRSTLSL